MEEAADTGRREAASESTRGSDGGARRAAAPRAPFELEEERGCTPRRRRERRRRRPARQKGPRARWDVPFPRGYRHERLAECFEVLRCREHVDDVVAP